MCNLYSVTKGHSAIRDLFSATHDRAGNLPPLSAIFPDQMAPIVRVAADGARELVMARWGKPSKPFTWYALMLLKHLSDVSLEDVNTLCDDGVLESRFLDFKAEPIGGRDKDKREFLADVCAFANASGGDLILGITTKDGAAAVVCGIDLVARVIQTGGTAFSV